MSTFERQLPLLSTLACVWCLGFFYLLDRVLFASSHFSPIFQFLLTVYDTQTAWAAVAVCMLALLWRRPAPADRVVHLFARHPAMVSAAWILPLALAAVFVYRAYPLCMDEYAAVFQARVFAAGQLTARLPTGLLDWFVLPGFNGAFLVASPVTGQVIEGYWPGFSLLLAPFQWLGVPWLCNPVISAVALWLMVRITVELSGDRLAGGWALLFAIGSGAFFVDGISFYSMQAHMTANLLFAWLLFSPTPARALAAGLVGSIALVLHNPFPHALFATPWLLGMLADPVQRRRLAWVVLGYLPVVLVVGGGWLWLRTGLSQAAHPGASAESLVQGVFGWPTADILNMRSAALAKLWVWAVPGLPVFAALGARRHWADRRVRLFVASAILTFAAYLFVSMDQGHGWGYRYFHSAWGVLPILAGCALARRKSGTPSWAAFAGTVALLSLLLIVPLQLHQIDGFMVRHLQQLPAPRRPGNNVYFIDWRDGFYSADMVQFDPLLRDADLLLARRGDALDAALIRRNWPQARRIAAGYWGEQWYLGPRDLRVPSAAAAGAAALQVSPP
ncbi:MAG: hypothetical protein JSS24_16430 [Proteobacteria bacterium]|nr:hypothetical protein [Pseudomonadota bacterium]